MYKPIDYLQLTILILVIGWSAFFLIRAIRKIKEGPKETKEFMSKYIEKWQQDHTN